MSLYGKEAAKGHSKMTPLAWSKKEKFIEESHGFI